MLDVTVEGGNTGSSKLKRKIWYGVLQPVIDSLIRQVDLPIKFRKHTLMGTQLLTQLSLPMDSLLRRDFTKEGDETH